MLTELRAYFKHGLLLPKNQWEFFYSKNIYFKILQNFTQNFLITFLFSHLHINFYLIQSKLQLQNCPFSTAISILQLQKIGTTARLTR